MINRASLQMAFDVLDYLQSKGIRCIIAGGCARDIFFGVRPKDIDIICADCTMDEVFEVLDAANFAFSTHNIYGESSEDRVEGCYKFLTVPIDVVVYKTRCVTEAIDAFDFNLNQFALSGTRHGIDGAEVRFCGATHWGRFTPVRQDYTVKRFQRMADKYLELVPLRATGELIVTAPVGGPHGIF